MKANLQDIALLQELNAQYASPTPVISSMPLICDYVGEKGILSVFNNRNRSLTNGRDILAFYEYNFTLICFLLAELDAL